MVDDEYDFLVKILLIGEPGVGKSSFCKRLYNNEYDRDYSSTIGVDFFCIFSDIDSKIYKLQIWDTAGQEKFRSITRSYYKNSKIILLMFDLNDYDSIEHINKWIAEVYHFCGEDIKIFLIGNKSDLGINIDKRKLQEIINKNNCHYLEVSVKENNNIKVFYEKFNEIINEIPREFITINNKSNQVDLSKKIVKKNNCCTIS